MSNLKTISYRGGLITFCIPTPWCEEYEPDGGGTFYREGGSTTLRLNVLTMKSGRDLSESSAAQAVTRSGPNERRIRKLANGNAVARYFITAVEDGQPLEIHYWELAGPLPPSHMRLAIFAHTVLASASNDPTIVAELQLLDQSISAAEFAKVREV